MDRSISVSVLQELNALLAISVSVFGKDTIAKLEQCSKAPLGIEVISVFDKSISVSFVQVSKAAYPISASVFGKDTVFREAH